MTKTKGFFNVNCNSMTFGYSFQVILGVLDVLTRSNYIGAVFVIVFMQYRSTLLSSMYKVIDDGIIQTLESSIRNLTDAIRGYYHALHEIVRSIMQNYVFFFVNDSEGRSYDRNPFGQKDSTSLENNDTPNNSSRNGYNKRHSSRGPPPPLVMVKGSAICTKDVESPNIKPTVLTTEIFEKDMNPLEPAFLNKEDYPPGWLVYHSVLGVSSVEDVDRYNEQRQLTKKRKKKRQQHEVFHLEKESDLMAVSEQRNSHGEKHDVAITQPKT